MSEFTKKYLEGKEVWLTFDSAPIDHYGRRLAYVWTCPESVFSEDQCVLFNAHLIDLGYARMERRFPFFRYEMFDIKE